jgi:hypothetical protein
MAFQAERADVLQVAFTAALSDREDVVGIPKASPRDARKTPVREVDGARGTAGFLQPKEGTERIYATDGADPLVSPQHLLAKVTRA